MTAAELKIDRQLQELAVTDWEKFKSVTGLDLSTFAVCQMRKANKSYQQIATAMNTTKDVVRYACKKCLD